MGLFGGGQEQPSGGLNLGVPQQNGYAQSQSPFGQSQENAYAYSNVKRHC